MGVLHTVYDSSHSGTLTTERTHAPWWSRPARILAVGAALLGLFLAVDALLLFVFIVANALLGGGLNPYSGLLLFIVVPGLVAIGVGGAWVAYQIWCAVPR
jgi:hypothetical protein